LAAFRGTWYHSSDWPHEGVDFTGKRVGIIGTSSTGTQMAPVIATQAAHLTVFQRTPQFTIPARHDSVDHEFLARVKANYAAVWELAKWSPGGFPFRHNGVNALDVTAEERMATYEALWREGGFKFLYGAYKDLLSDRRANDTVSEFVRAKIRERVDDPDTAEILLPNEYPFGARRPVIDTDYFEMFNRGNVSLADIRHFPIVEATATGLRTEAGHHDLDVLIFATGFDAVTGPFLRMQISGRDSRTLQEKWADGPETYLGLAVSGFPNLFMITGPGSTFGNAPVSIEHHVEWIAACISYLRAHHLELIEADPAAELEWAQHVQEAGEKTLIPLAESWFNGANIPGKPRAFFFYPGSFRYYRKQCDAIAAAGYEGFVFGPRPDAAASAAVGSADCTDS
jgi:cation diffusion facilitator CzcD-associated flavoprotein CzcO